MILGVTGRWLSLKRDSVTIVLLKCPVVVREFDIWERGGSFW